LKFTGERLIPGIPRLENMIVEELARLNIARKFFQNVTALDFGCGAGYAANFMLDQGANNVLGIDISPEIVHFAAMEYKKNRLSYSPMDCLNTGLASNSFGFICSLDVIEHFAEADTHRFLAEIKRLLIPGGWCLLTTPNKLLSSPNTEQPSWQFHLKEFFYDEFQTILNGYFSQVNIFGVRIPIYEDIGIRRITNSPLSKFKHFLPARIRVGFSSGLRYFLKADLAIEDVKVSKENVENSRVFVALCQK